MSKQLIEADPKCVKNAEGIDPYRSLKVSEFFSETLQGEGVSSGVPAAFLRLKDCTLNCHFCFKAGTRVHLKRGLTKIEEVIKGDVLLTLDKDNGIVETVVEKTIVSEIESEDLGCVRLKCASSNNRIFVTRNHPFMVKDKGWVKMEDLQAGDILIALEDYQFNSYRMSQNNPSFNAEFLSKSMATQKQLRLEGKIQSYERSDELKQAHSKRMLENNPSFDAETHKRSSENRFKGPSKLEQKYIDLFEGLSFPIKYTGNNKYSVGDHESRYRFPDFKVEGKLKLIEIYDTTAEYHIYKTKSRYKRDSAWEDKTRDFYKKFDHEVLFLTERDILLPNRVELTEKLFNYVFNGIEVESIDLKVNKKQSARLWGNSVSRKIPVYNFQCTPFNSYLAEKCLVHNCDSVSVWRYGNTYSFEELFATMEEAGLIQQLKTGTRLVATGGSPLRQQTQLVSFIIEFNEKYGFKPFIEIENECTLMPSEGMINITDQWNNSPKLENSQNKKELRYKPEILKALSEIPNSWFKFVVSEESDWEEIEKDFLEPGLIRREQVILMPCGESQEELSKTREMAAEMAIREGVRFSDRLHITLWNKRVGV